MSTSSSLYLDDGLCSYSYSRVPDYELNLSLSPRNRWKSIIEANTSILPGLRKYIDEVIRSDEFGGPIIGPIFIYIFHNILAIFSCFLIDKEYEEEMRGIADITTSYGLKYADILSLNLGYDLLARCTSIISRPYHIRLMDWECEAFINKAIDIKVIKEGQLIGKITTWPTIIGVLTGIRYQDDFTDIKYNNSDINNNSGYSTSIRHNTSITDGYTLAINYRQTGKSFLPNLISFFFKKAQPICFLSRRLFDNYSSYSHIIPLLLSTPLMAPMYISAMGTKHNQGIIITRDRDTNSNSNGNRSKDGVQNETNQSSSYNRLTNAHIQLLNDSNNELLIQTNCDINFTSTSHTHEELLEWSDGDELLLSSVVRRDMAKIHVSDWLNEKNRRNEKNSTDSILNSISHYPIVNRFTNYVTIMAFDTDGQTTYETRSVLSTANFNKLDNDLYSTLAKSSSDIIKERKIRSEVEKKVNDVSEQSSFLISSPVLLSVLVFIGSIFISL